MSHTFSFEANLSESNTLRPPPQPKAIHIPLSVAKPANGFGLNGFSGLGFDMNYV